MARTFSQRVEQAPANAAPTADPTAAASQQISPRKSAFPGMIAPGNIDLTNRPRVKNADGSVSTVRSMSVNIDGNEVLVPTVSNDGRIMSEEEAVQTYMKTGQHLGIFDDAKSATKYAKKLHEDQAKLIEEKK